jgi:hypothetical protein
MTTDEALEYLNRVASSPKITMTSVSFYIYPNREDPFQRNVRGHISVICRRKAAESVSQMILRAVEKGQSLVRSKKWKPLFWMPKIEELPRPSKKNVLQFKAVAKQ